MIDGEHYIRGLSDNELEKFVGLNRNMYTKPELQIADDESAKRKRARAAATAAGAKPQAPAAPAKAPTHGPAPAAAPAAKPAPPEPTAVSQPTVEPPKPARPETAPVKSPSPKTDWSAVDGEPYMFCIHCGRKLKLKADYCTQCGGKVSLTEEPEEYKPVMRAKDIRGALRRPSSRGMDCGSGYNDDSCDSCCNPRI